MPNFKAVLSLISPILVVAVFSRQIGDSFDLTKFVALSLVGALSITAAVNESSLDLVRSNSPVFFASSCFLIGLVSSSMAGGFTAEVLLGQYLRQTGLISYLSCIAFFWFLSLKRDQSRTYVSFGLLTAFLINAGYSILQILDLDPFAWRSQAFSVFVMGTIGNPNTAAAFFSATFALVWLSASQKPVAGPIFRTFLVAVALLLLVQYNSFQGNIGLLISAALIAYVESKARLSASSVLLIAGVLAVSVKSNWSTFHFIFLLLLLLAVEGIGPAFGSRFSFPRFRRHQYLPPIIAVTLLFVIVFWDSIERQIRSGLSERSSFMRAGVSMFRSEPIWGMGLEGFGSNFGRFRPVSNAIEFENSLSSSAHSVPIGLAASGGLILLLAAGFFAFVISRRAIDVLSDENDDWLHRGAAIGWLVLLVISIVSVENIVLMFLAFTFAGILAQPQATVARDRRRTKQLFSRRLLTAVVMLSSLLFVFLVPLSEYRAMSESQRLTKELSSGRRDDELLTIAHRVEEFAIRPGLPTMDVAQVELLLGKRSEGSIHLAEGLRHLGYPPSAVPAYVDLLVQIGYPEIAVEVTREALVYNPKGPAFLSFAATFFDSLSQSFEAQGFYREALAAADEANEIRSRLTELEFSE